MGIVALRESYVGIVLALRTAVRTARQARRACLTAHSSPAAVRFETRSCHAETRLRAALLHCRRRGQAPGSPHRDGMHRLFANEENNVSAVIEHLEGEARERLIVWLKRRMQECNITLEALQHALQQDIDEAKRVRYRDASGNTWTGDGEHPEWLRRAVAAGQSVDHFLCE